MFDKRIFNKKQQANRVNFFHTNLFAISVICFSGIIIYSNTFLSTFHFDDAQYIVNNFAIRNIGNLKAIWNCFPTRFITFFTFALNYHFNAVDVFGYHVFNLVIHLGSAVLIWWLTTIIFSTPTMQKDKLASFSKPIALFAALIFVSHPIQTESVTYIWQRCTSLAALFFLLSLCLYIKSRLLEADGNQVLQKKIFYALSLIFAAISMFTKENSATLPLIIILCEFYFLKTPKHIKWKYIIPFLFLLPIVPAILFLAKPDTFSDLERLFHRPADAAWHYFINQLRVIVTYVRLAFIPLNQNLDYDYPILRSIFKPQAILSFITLSAILFTAFKLSKKYKPASFGIFWFFITLLPESSIIPLKDIIFEHRLYLPMAGFSIFLVSGLYYLFPPKKFKLLVTMLSIMIIAYSFMTYQRNNVWRDEITLWDDAIHKSPGKARPYNNRGYVYHAQGNFTQAISDFTRAIELNPNLADGYYNRGVTYHIQGNLAQAISDFTRAIKIDPNYVDAYRSRGLIYAMQDKFPQAISDYTKVVENNPGDAKTYNNRGVAYFKQSSLTQAISDYSKAIEINPNYARAYRNRGSAYFSKKNLIKAWEDVHKVESLGAEVDPEFIEKLKKASGREK